MGGMLTRDLMGEKDQVLGERLQQFWRKIASFLTITSNWKTDQNGGNYIQIGGKVRERSIHLVLAHLHDPKNERQPREIKLCIAHLCGKERMKKRENPIPVSTLLSNSREDVTQISSYYPQNTRKGQTSFQIKIACENGSSMENGNKPFLRGTNNSPRYEFEMYRSTICL